MKKLYNGRDRLAPALSLSGQTKAVLGGTGRQGPGEPQKALGQSTLGRRRRQRPVDPGALLGRAVPRQREGVPIPRRTQEEGGQPLGGHAKGRGSSPRTDGLSRPPRLSLERGLPINPPFKAAAARPHSWVPGGDSRAPAQLLPKPCPLPGSPQPSALKEFQSQKPARMGCPILSLRLSFPI